MFSVGWLFYTLVTSQLVICLTYSFEKSQYECGAHGKFEYCIDDIPACVVGCHCHPGFYFDTDTKICEPNAKLTENIRRRYVPEETRLYPIYTSTIESIPTPTTAISLDESVGKNTKDDNDLSEWLYNQFFKTIEARVINNTNVNPPTRRKGSDLYRSISDDPKAVSTGRKSNNYNFKRKSHKSSKKRGKKKKSNADSLRRKLLRITEDDSLFDSSDSGLNSDSSDSSSSSNSEISKERNGNTNNDREHGHKKVIMFNRRPRPPLPSFIILPSMDTPYYPPIGLPPPPVLPMYPLVPIPPMAPNLSFLEPTSNSTTLPTITTTTITTTTTTIKPDSSLDEYSLSTHLTTTTSSNDTSTDMLRSRRSKPRKLKMYGTNNTLKVKSSQDLIHTKDTEMENPIGTEQAQWIKLLQKIKARLKMKHNIPSSAHNIIDDLEEDAPLLNDIQALQGLSSFKPKYKIQKDKGSKLNDFKYLSELIHRVNLSDMKPLNKIINNDNLRNLDNITNMHRRYNQQQSQMDHKETSGHKNSDDIYFMKLGRQIASWIRATDSKFNNSDYMTKEHINNRDSSLSIINENRYPSHAFWERSARSPLLKIKKYFASLNNYKDENNLLSLEDEVNTFASTMSPMTLQEIENILSTFQKHDLENKKNNNMIQKPSTILDIDLFSTKPTKFENLYKSFFQPLEYASNIPQRRNLDNTNIINHAASNVTQYLNYTNENLPTMVNDWKLLDELSPKIYINQLKLPQQNNIHLLNQSMINNTSNNENLNYYKRPTTYFPVDIMVKQKIPKISPETYFTYSKGVPEIKYMPPKQEQLSKIIDKLHEHPYRFVNYPSVFHKHSNLPDKHVDLATNYRDKTMNYPKLFLKYSDQTANPHELSLKAHNLTIKYHELPTKYYELPINQHLPDDLNAKYIERTTKYHGQLEKPEKYSKTLEKDIEVPESSKIRNEFSYLTVKYPEWSSKFQKYQADHPKKLEFLPNFPEYSRKNPELTSHYLPKTTIFNYQNKKLFPDIPSDKHQYYFEASYPLRRPSFRRIFSKGIESPSYVHHELHHFDYFI